MTSDKLQPHKMTLDADVKNIAVVRLGGWADTVLASFIGPALKEKFPNAKVTLILGKSLADWASALNFDDVILINDKFFYSKNRLQQMSEISSAALKIRGKGFDLGISLHHTWHFGSLLKLAGVKKAIGLIRQGGQAPLLLEKAVPGFDQTVDLKVGISEIDRYLELLKIIDINPEKLNFKLKVRQGVHDEIMLRLASLGLRSKGFLALGPGGGENVQRKFFHMRWPYFPEFLRLFCQKSDLPILLLGGPSDVDLVPPLLYVSPGRVHSLVGKTSREEALAIVGESSAFVGVDAGLSHIAGSVGIPGVVLFGPTSAKNRNPPGSGKNLICLDSEIPCSPCFSDEGGFNWSCPDNVCMKSISPQDVWGALNKVAKIQNS